MSSKIPRVLLIGAGRFGKEHLKTLQNLEKDARVQLAGVVVASEESSGRIAEHFGVSATTQLTAELLRGVDGVDIVTPSSTHAELARRCLRHTNVLVEKPLAMTLRQAESLRGAARRSKRKLMVAQVYRFHPVIRRLRELTGRTKRRPRLIIGRLVNPSEEGVEKYEANLEFLHLFDIVDYLFGVMPKSNIGRLRGGAHLISLKYPGEMKAVFTIGWEGTEKQRVLELVYEDRRLICDLAENVIHEYRPDGMQLYPCHGHPRPLYAELATFASVIGGNNVDFPDARIGARIVDIATRAKPKQYRRRPRIAIIGGGIFGSTCALELSKFCDVRLFEQRNALLSGVSFLNMWRHHAGFHYPRSPATVQEIQDARDDFMSEYADAVVSDFPSYYCTSIDGMEIPRERFLAFCDTNGLNYSHKQPPPDIVDLEQISLCVETDEGVYDMPRFKEIVEQRLRREGNINVSLETEVINGKIQDDGQKILRFRDRNGTHEKSFDYVVNATYSNWNLMSNWFGFPVKRLRFDLLELLVLRMPVKKISVTILDGPFTTLVSMGRDGLFMLEQVHDCTLRRTVTSDGLPPKWKHFESNRANIMTHSTRYLPILKKAEIVESRFGMRAVQAFSDDFDGRPTVVTDHGFGCWTLLGGKIITCVSNAREVATSIRLEQGMISP